MYVVAAASESTTSWAIGYTIAIVVVLVVVALVVPILLLARAQHGGVVTAGHDPRLGSGDHRRTAPGPREAGGMTW